MPETRLGTKSETSLILGPWPDVAAARLFLSHMADGAQFPDKLPDLPQLTEWLNQLELGAFGYTYFKNWDEPQARTAVEHLESAYWAGIAAAGIKVTVLEEILHRFRAEGIDCTLVKGIAFGATIYSEHAVRSMNDMDLWIQKKDLPVVYRVLKEMGYQDDGEGHDFDQMPDYISEMSFYPDKPQLSKWNLEIHWDLLPRPGLMGRLPLESWWQRRSRAVFQGREVMVLDPADALVHACTHQLLQHSNRLRLRWLLDIDRLVRGQGSYHISPLHWQRLETEYCDSELWPVIQAGLHLAAQWFATPLPDQVKEMFSKPLSTEQRLFYLFYAVPDMTIGKRMFDNLQEERGFKHRAQMLLRFLFPRPKYMMERYEISNKALLPFYYVGRIFKGFMSFLQG